jgi:hypothetical protein
VAAGQARSGRLATLPQLPRPAKPKRDVQTAKPGKKANREPQVRSVRATCGARTVLASTRGSGRVPGGTPGGRARTLKLIRPLHPGPNDHRTLPAGGSTWGGHWNRPWLSPVARPAFRFPKAGTARRCPGLLRSRVCSWRRPLRPAMSVTMRAIRACSAAPNLLPAAQPTPRNGSERSDGNRRCSMASTFRKEKSAAVPTWAYHACRQCRNRQKDGSVRIPARAIRALAYHKRHRRRAELRSPACTLQLALQTRGRGPCET